VGEIPTISRNCPATSARIMEWADEVRKLGVRANADTPDRRRMARDFGAQGIGLCRTEHMFFDSDRIAAVREMIVADNGGQPRKALAKLLPMQRDDFVELFEIMAGCRSPSACLIRRCTNSCRMASRRDPRSGRQLDVDPELVRAARG
jgi:pyruvate,orthophosphate dikinase